MNQNEHEPAPATSATPTAATEPTPQIVENRDLAAAVPATADAPEPIAPFRRTTCQFDLGNGRRLVDMRTTSGGVEIIPEAPGVNFDDLPTMTRDEAILAALDACEKIAPDAEVYLVSNIDPGEFAAAYRAALEYRRERDRRTP